MTRPEVEALIAAHRSLAEALRGAPGVSGALHEETALALDGLLRQIDQMRQSAERVLAQQEVRTRRLAVLSSPVGKEAW